MQNGSQKDYLKVVSKTDNALAPSVNYYGGKIKLRFTGSFSATTDSYIQS